MDNRVSTLLKNQFPFFVREDHPLFVTFLEKYYEFMEQEGVTLAENGAYFSQGKFIAYNDIDTTHDELLSRFYDEFLLYFPDDMAANRQYILKHILDFYRAKGTEDSLKFLLRAFYNIQDITVYYPKQDILKASDGKWLVERSLRISDLYVDASANLDAVSLYTGTRVRGATSNASATVERVELFYENNFLVRELVLSNRTGNFTSGEMIFANTVNGQYLTSNLHNGSIIELVITNPGSGYNVGDPITITSNTGTGANAIVSQVANSGLEDIELIAGGYGYQTVNLINITGDGANANVTIDTVDTSELYHPNTLTLAITTLGEWANVVNAYSASETIEDTLTSVSLTGLGPISTINVHDYGTEYTYANIAIQPNTILAGYGVIGRLNVVSGGANYAVGDKIYFSGGSGFGLKANVTSVDGNGAIVNVAMVQHEGAPNGIIGGLGYSNTAYPVSSYFTTANGAGANVAAVALMGQQGQITFNVGLTGRIRTINLISGGSGYETPPTINIAAYGNADATIISKVQAGTFTYPGRYIKDDGFLSAYNFIQDRHYYQNFSYEVQSEESYSRFERAVHNFTHPAGTKLFAKTKIPYDRNTENLRLANDAVASANTLYVSNYTIANTVGTVTYISHGLANDEIVYLNFGNTALNSLYEVSNVTANTFTVEIE